MHVTCLACAALSGANRIAVGLFCFAVADQQCVPLYLNAIGRVGRSISVEVGQTGFSAASAAYAETSRAHLTMKSWMTTNRIDVVIAFPELRLGVQYQDLIPRKYEPTYFD